MSDCILNENIINYYYYYYYYYYQSCIYGCSYCL